ncbi:unnamed protein product [Linum trigynum]|uniref:Uncharacterized protein n=1 Tax=Linum trigynum TaxID=586398 RepID=A0AAV2GD06_9ROSI
MEGHLTKLHRCLFESSSSSSEFLHSLRSDTSIAIALALQHFYLTLKRGVSVVVEEEAHDDGESVEDKKLGFQLWTDSQIQSVVSFGLAIVSASISFSEPVVIAVVQQLLEFAVCYLEKSEFCNDESSVQINLILLMELALVKEIDKVPDRSCPLSCILELLAVVSSGPCDVQFDSHIKCILQGSSCLRAEKQVDLLLMTLETEYLQPEGQTSGFNGPIHATSHLIYASQHWALIHVGFVRRLIPHCTKLIERADVHGEKVAAANFSERLSFSLRILRLLRSLVKENPYVEYDAYLLQQVASFADTLPSVFGHRFEFADNQGAIESDFENLVLSLLEEFLHLVQSIFGNNSISQNIQVCIVASILDNLDSSIWKSDKSAVGPKPPLVYLTQTVVLMLRIVQDVRRAISQSYSSMELDRNLTGSSSDFPNKSPSCHLRLKEVPLTKSLTTEEAMKVIFTSSAQWLDNLIQLIIFLHLEGMNFRPRFEKSQSSSLKANCAVELENAACHEDEALFGNLFVESGRSVGSVEVCDQAPVALSSFSNSCNLPMQAACELLGVLKDVIFSQEYPTLYEEGCKTIRNNHIEALLSLVNCQECGLEYKSSDGFASSPDEGKTANIHKLCLEL